MTTPAAAVPAPRDVGRLSVFILAVMMILTPGLGVFGEEMLQDTFKSMIVAMGTLCAAAVFFWQSRRGGTPWVWHDILLVPLALMVYALGSMAWSHAYLAGAEAVRWFVLSVLMWVTTSTLRRDRMPVLAAGIHLGAVMASFWAALQFWFNFGLFIQGPNPASTFVNRNFLAEFLVCSLPFAVWLLARARTPSQSRVLACSTGWVILAVLMTGTRSAMVALLLLALALPVLLVRYRQQLPIGQWPRAQQILAVTILLATVLGLGLLRSDNPRINADFGPQAQVSALARAFQRTALIGSTAEYTSGSFSLRLRMWHDTIRMIAANPVTGVGAGAWEVAIPLYQAAGAQVETDYYAHNEVLQLLAEYGLVGWGIVLTLGAFVIQAIRRTLLWPVRDEAPERWIALLSLLALLFVSCAGFALRLATTGAMLALSLGMLAASDAAASPRGFFGARVRALSSRAAQRSLGVTLLALTLAAYISEQAAQCEQKIVRAVTTALSITDSGLPANDPRLADARTQVMRLVQEGIAINPHYRKITPMVADELARWGDWKDAAWVWESVVASRPNIVAIHANIARCYLRLNQMDKARVAFERAEQLQPTAPAVQALAVVYWARLGQEDRALALAQQLLNAKMYDMDVLDVAYELAMKSHRLALAVQSMSLRKQTWPDYSVDSLLKIAAAYDKADPGDEVRALQTYREALRLTPESIKDVVRARIPTNYLARL